MLNVYQLASYTYFSGTSKPRRTFYDNIEDITPEQLMKAALNKYEVLPTPKKWNTKSTKQEQIMVPTTVVEK